MSDNIAIKAENIDKTFRLPHEKHNSIKSLFVNIFRHQKTYEIQNVLQDVSFEVKQGEFFGIVGRNGSGKSTLLKLLAGIYTPTKGTISIKGKLTPFIELGVGFNPELTGRENVFLNGALLGFNRHEMAVMYNEIVEFAELEKFMDQKLKNYSSGMQVRLAFSIAIRVQSDILLLDEVLAVGDAAFQRKCFEYFSSLKSRRQTVIFISHDMESVMKYCDRVAWLNKGSIIDIDIPQKVLPNYMESFMRIAADAQDDQSDNSLPIGVSAAIDADLSYLTIGRTLVQNISHKTTQKLTEKDTQFFVKFRIKVKKELTGFIPGVVITNQMGEVITASNFLWGEQDLPKKLLAGSTYEAEFQLPNIYEKGQYKISVNIVSPKLTTFYGWQNNVLELYIDRKYVTGGKVNPPYKAELKNLL